MHFFFMSADGQCSKNAGFFPGVDVSSPNVLLFSHRPFLAEVRFRTARGG